MEKIMENEGLWHIRDQIFGYLTIEELVICRQASIFWNESLEPLEKQIRHALVKRLKEIGVVICPSDDYDPIDDYEMWSEAVKKLEARATTEDINAVVESFNFPLEVSDSDSESNNFIAFIDVSFNDPFHAAIVLQKDKALKLMEFLIFDTSFNLNATESDDGEELGIEDGTLLHFACAHGCTEIAQLLIKSSQNRDIDLNQIDYKDRTPFHYACANSPDIARFMIENHEEFEIDLTRPDYRGETPLEYAKECANYLPDMTAIIDLLKATLEQKL